MTLYSRTSNNIQFLDALEQCSEVLLRDSAVALLYSPSWCGFAQVGPTANDWKLSPRDETRFDPDSIFEARVFSKEAELRWLKDWPNKGRAALISESNISSYLDSDAKAYPSEKVIEQTYLLWGEGIETRNDELPDGWSRLAMARVGTIDVPHPDVNARDQRVCIVAREYLGVIDEHGNVAVVEERLMELRGA